MFDANCAPLSFPGPDSGTGDKTCSLYEVSNPSAISRSCFARSSDNYAHFLRDDTMREAHKKPPVECTREVDLVSKYDSGSRVHTPGNLLEDLLLTE